ncbi:sex peptide receptor-like [Mercenaria mercenaria]|uniref:sex peptide receptor-like n=1 Tax=Mercenaria mercenaria TaxID=6596 RepID=UPI00234F4642|nr:sex peptide receptor-like [Mercenaria mercenaria]
MENITVSTNIYNSTESNDEISTADVTADNDSFIADDSSAYNYDYENSTYYYYEYYEDYYLEIYNFEIYALGYVQPILILLTTLTNLFIVGFFLTKKNRGKTTNLLFISIALSDTMTSITLLPNGFGVYAADRVFLSRDWCNTYMILRFYVSPVFHTVSVWQTVVLCIQRYMCVCHPFISGRICTFWKTFASIGVMYCLATVMHVYHLVNNKLGHVRCRWQTEIPCKESCMYLWFCVTLQHLLPCIVLVILTVITIKELEKAQRRVSTMSHRRSVSRSARDKIITYTAAFIVLMFLIPELPHGIYRLVFLVFKHEGNYNGIPPFHNHIIICVYEIVLTISFNANFWIYCFMMRDFRHKVLKLLTCGAFKRGLARLRSLSMSSRGSVRTTLSRSSSNASRNRVFSRTTSLHSTASENVHAVIPLTPTRGYDKINYHEQSAMKAKEDDTNDDVFM